MKPTVGQWYRLGIQFGDGDRVEVIAYDEDDEFIEVQHVDGTVEEIDIEEWNDYVANHEVKMIDAPFEADEINADDE